METTARFYLERMRLQIERARRHQFPAASDVPAKWLAYIEGRLKSIEFQLNNPPMAAEADIVSQRLLTNLFACYEELDHLSRADTTQVADYVVMALLRWFDAANSDCDYLFTADKEFELEPLFVKADMEAETQHPQYQPLIEALKPIVYRITMPGGALGAGFHIPLVGHEVGHVLIESFGEELDPSMQKLARGVHEDLKPVYQRWLHEIVADTICGFISGPAAFFALHEKLRGSMDPNQDYPENAVRTRSLWDFTSERFGEAFASRSIDAGQWQSWSVRTDDDLLRRAAAHGHYSVISTKLVGDANRARAMALDLALRHIPRLEYRAEDFANDIKMHLKSFLWVIPPFETSGDLRKRSPTTIASILNVGWFIAAFKLDELKIKMTDGPDRKGKILVELDRLMLKSIELSEIRRQWEDEDERTGPGEAVGKAHGRRAAKKARRRSSA